MSTKRIAEGIEMRKHAVRLILVSWLVPVGCDVPLVDRAAESEKDEGAPSSTSPGAGGGTEVRLELPPIVRFTYDLSLPNEYCGQGTTTQDGDVVSYQPDSRCRYRSASFDFDLVALEYGWAGSLGDGHSTGPKQSVELTTEEEQKLRAVLADAARCHLTAGKAAACHQMYKVPHMTINPETDNSVEIGSYAACNNVSYLCDGKEEELKALMTALAERLLDAHSLLELR